MKIKLHLFISIIVLCLAATTVKANTVDEDTKPKTAIASMTEEQKQERILQIKARVAEIKAMDKSQLDQQQRKALRAELKEMKREAHAMGSNGVYLSVGAIIVGVLVLILVI